MRDKQKENILKALRKGSTLSQEDRNWILAQLKTADSISYQSKKLKQKQECLMRELAKLELTHSCQSDEQSRGFVEAVQQIYSLLQNR